MALLKDYPWKEYTPQHWRIVNRQPNDDANRMVVTMSVWRNKLAYTSQPENNKRKNQLPISLMFYFDGAELTKAQIYELVKTALTCVDMQTGLMIENPLLGAVDDN